MPAYRVNQNSKREWLSFAEALQPTALAIAEWWAVTYLRPEDRVLLVRFAYKARASLPGLPGADGVSGPEVQVAIPRADTTHWERTGRSYAS